jgi:hypothetical protein
LRREWNGQEMLGEIYKTVEDFWYDYGDPRAQDFLFTRTPYPIIVTIIIYVFICEVRKIGKRIRKK